MNNSASYPRSCPTCGLFSTVCTRGIEVTNPQLKKYSIPVAAKDKPLNYAALHTRAIDDTYGETTNIKEWLRLESKEAALEHATRYPYDTLVEYRTLSIKTTVEFE